MRVSCATLAEVWRSRDDGATWTLVAQVNGGYTARFAHAMWSYADVLTIGFGSAISINAISTGSFLSGQTLTRDETSRCAREMKHCALRKTPCTHAQCTNSLPASSALCG